MEDKLIGNNNSVIDMWGKEWKFQCMGCAIVNHEMEVPGGLIYEDKEFTIQQDPAIPINGFIIINFKKHINSISLMKKEERIQLMELINRVIVYLKELKIAEEVTIVQEERCHHFHIWIFPYHKWMDKFGRGVSNLREICQYAKENATEKDKNLVLETVVKLKERFEEERN